MYEYIYAIAASISSDLSSGVRSVDGHMPDNQGAVTFELVGDKWLKSDANGHITETDETPVAVDDTEQGVLYNDFGTLEYKQIGSNSNDVAAGDHDHGNITNDGKMTDCIATSCLVVTTNDGTITHSDGLLSEHSYAGSDLATLDHLVSSITWVDGYPNWKATSGGGISSVNNQTPPPGSGNINLSGIVYTIDGKAPDANGNYNISGMVKSVNNVFPDDNGNVSIDLSVESVLSDYVKSITVGGS